MVWIDAGLVSTALLIRAGTKNFMPAGKLKKRTKTRVKKSSFCIVEGSRNLGRKAAWKPSRNVTVRCAAFALGGSLAEPASDSDHIETLLDSGYRPR